MFFIFHYASYKKSIRFWPDPKDASWGTLIGSKVAVSDQGAAPKVVPIADLHKANIKVAGSFLWTVTIRKSYINDGEKTGAVPRKEDVFHPACDLKEGISGDFSQKWLCYGGEDWSRHESWEDICEPGKYPSFISRLLNVSCYPEFLLVNKIFILEI